MNKIFRRAASAAVIAATTAMTAGCENGTAPGTRIGGLSPNSGVSDSFPQSVAAQVGAPVINGSIGLPPGARQPQSCRSLERLEERGIQGSRTVRSGVIGVGAGLVADLLGADRKTATAIGAGAGLADLGLGVVAHRQQINQLRGQCQADLALLWTETCKLTNNERSSSRMVNGRLVGNHEGRQDLAKQCQKFVIGNTDYSRGLTP